MFSGPCLPFNVLSNSSGTQLPADCLLDGGLYRLVLKRGNLSRSAGDERGQTETLFLSILQNADSDALEYPAIHLVDVAGEM